MALNIKPLSDRVIVEPAAAETKTASGIFIPDTAKEKPQKGIVLAVGNGKKDEPMTVKIGDTVLYGKYAGTELKLEGKDYLIMREEDILAIIVQRLTSLSTQFFGHGFSSFLVEIISTSGGGWFHKAAPQGR